MNRLLHGFLDRMIRVGSLEIVDAKGEVHRFGDGTGTRVRVRFTSARAERNVILYPHLKLGEEFMDGGFVVDEGSLYDFLAVAQSNISGITPRWWMKAGLGLRYLPGTRKRSVSFERMPSPAAQPTTSHQAPLPL